uniref:Putative secreted protein n=1 Tax=Ixodes ricinus TaxID=34613 RepID=A0A6B0U8E4_IXORI
MCYILAVCETLSLATGVPVVSNLHFCFLIGSLSHSPAVKKKDMSIIPPMHLMSPSYEPYVSLKKPERRVDISQTAEHGRENSG